MQSLSAAPSASKKKLEFSYDGQSRRVGKKVFAWSGSAYTLNAQTKFIYDGWNLVAETDASNTVQRSYVWGNDLSGTLQGAGGVGGLLAIKAGEESFLPGYDGNGNVMALVKSSNQSISASYTYGAFGEAIQADEVGVANPFRFSTKYHDIETGFAYYGYRYYNPQIGRWINKDPIQEEGGVNLYGFVANNAIERTDALGLKWDTLDFLGYFYLGKGKPINLSPIGYLQDVKAEIKRRGILDRFQKKPGTGSIEDEARKTGPKVGSFKADFKNSYNFSRVHYVFGSITLSGEFFGRIECKDGKFEYKGEAVIIFEDLFEDLLDLKDHKHPSPMVDAQLQPISNLAGAPYWIIEGWIEKFDGKL
jgi:RHS repeat-associated protein